MSKISDSARLESQSSASSENFSSGRPDALQKINHPFSIISAANKKIRLYSVLKNYGIKISQNNRGQVWSASITCPFPSHKGSKERTPSFGYNFIEDRFNCLGCKKSGRAVEFISEMEMKPRVSIAAMILDHYGDSSIIDEPFESDDPKIEELLFEASKVLRDAYLTLDKSKIKIIDKIAWWFDYYITMSFGSKNPSRSDIDLDNLSARVSKLKEIIEIVKKDTQ